MYQKESFCKRFFAVLIIFVYVFSILPADEISYTLKKRMDVFEYYAGRADLEKDENRWNKIIEEGYFAAINECEKDLLNEYEKELFLLTEMSHPGAKMILQKNADAIAQMGVDMNITNFVAPATRLDRLADIRQIVGEDAFIISPGVGKQGGDGKKTLQYSDAIIVGRSIYESENPQKSCEDLIKSVK